MKRNVSLDYTEKSLKISYEFILKQFMIRTNLNDLQFYQWSVSLHDSLVHREHNVGLATHKLSSAHIGIV